ncbi:hypothetical protein A374_15484 [Fictibacillus macauensis ZFHKF-1]|uniref:dUTPase n=1 Tax=Fictibacillus macauensis ZFHKF-1 TaxID=1196324 RepID=I8AG85_9BACL|nr:dUTP diphosphatase [Fictibacillus macauensis]EIT84419.1 hypothetical protein A374_15484 [Fictibacillus macauensis ZFHKF-1]
MNYTEWFELQHQLNERIVTEHGLKNEELYEKRLLALAVELGELANETRCFKYWSLKSPSSRDVIIEEYVDGLHFVLSVGLDLGYTNVKPLKKASETDVTGQFLLLYGLIDKLRTQTEEVVYTSLFSEFLRLGELLGFTLEEIHDAYVKKNTVNHVRQDEGY